ncbi:MAG TPA: LptF/LptG family permease, partial [Lacibacter sp.]|nr:LptF/LptG family permease [Lacibacter sp.]
RNVVIYEHSFSLQDQVILADEGSMMFSPDRRFLYFNLRNGWRYQEKGASGTIETDFYRLGFREYKKVFDLSSFKLNKSADSTFRNFYKMLSLQQLTTVVDSLRKLSANTLEKSDRELKAYTPFLLPDSIWKLPLKDTLRFTSAATMIPDSLKRTIFGVAASQTGTLKSQVELVSYEYREQQRQLRLHEVERHRKFTLSFACLVLFLIGAPLGSIIRKGGLGLPLVISVLFFIIFHIINTSGEKMVKEDVLLPFSGMWLSTAVLIPIGLFLTYKAMQDSQLFNAEFYYRILRRVRLSRFLREKAG